MINWLIQLSIIDKTYLSLAFVTTAAILVNWNRLDPNLKILILYPLAHFASGYPNASKFKPFLPNETRVLNQEDDYYNSLIVIKLTPSIPFSIISYAVLAIFFYQTFIQKSIQIRVLASIPLLWFLSKVNTYSTGTWEPVNNFSTVFNIVESVFVTYCCFVYFRELLNHDKQYRPEKDRTFWVVVGLLFYFIGNFFITGLLNYAGLTDEDLARNAAYIGYTFSYLFYSVLILVCFINFPLNNYE
ncbi:hypothetical protein GCM10027185_61380 [Spirosoma pulveris]